MRRNSTTSPSKSARIRIAPRPMLNIGSETDTEERPVLSVVEKVEDD